MIVKASIETESHEMEIEVMKNNIVFIKDDKGNNAVVTHKDGTPLVAALLKFMDAATKVFNEHIEEKKKLEGMK